MSVIILTVISLWLLFRSGGPQETIVPSTTEGMEDITSKPITPPAETESAIFTLSNYAAISPVVLDNKVLYYSKDNGFIYETDLEGKSTKQITNISIPNLITSIWSFDKSQAINIYEDNGRVKKAIFNISAQKAIELNSNIKFINFSPNKNKIAYQFVDERLGINKISIADSNDTNWQTIFNIRIDNAKIYWPSENLLAITTPPSGLIKGSALIKKIDDSQSGLIKLITDAYGLTIKYSDDGAKLIFSQTDQYGHNPSIYLLKDGNFSENLNISTISDKCAFSKNNNLYCAVPEVINGSLILPDDFYKGLTSFSDTLKKIDLINNRTSTIFNPKDFNKDFNMSDLTVSPNEDYLVFINKKDGLLYSIKIK